MKWKTNVIIYNSREKDNGEENDDKYDEKNDDNYDKETNDDYHEENDDNYIRFFILDLWVSK
jgi:hypothetical protein